MIVRKNIKLFENICKIIRIRKLFGRKFWVGFFLLSHANYECIFSTLKSASAFIQSICVRCVFVFSVFRMKNRKLKCKDCSVMNATRERGRAPNHSRCCNYAWKSSNIYSKLLQIRFELRSIILTAAFICIDACIQAPSDAISRKI